MPWPQTSRRQLPPGWARTRQRVLHRDPICRCEGCPLCTSKGCPRPSTDCDHIGNPDNHTDTNLRGLCHPCHKHRSAHQGAAARTRTRRPPEPHPGVVDP